MNYIKIYTELFKEENFINAAREKRICLFLGSGVGFNIGMPDWAGLAKELALFALENNAITRSEKLNLLNNNHSPLKIISICIDYLKEKNLNNKLDEFLKKIFYTNPRKKFFKSNIYKQLNSLYVEKKILILQTNYDVMIEKFQSKYNSDNKNYIIPYNTISIPKVDDLLGKIIYLHGRFDGSKLNPSTNEDIILTRKQYNDIYVLNNNPNAINQKNFISYILENFYIIFLGYSLNDIELLQLIANKPKTESFKKIIVIVDNCNTKQIENEINAKYLQEASNNKINSYYYDTEITGIKIGFEKMLISLIAEINNCISESTPLIKYIDPTEVDFNE